MKIKEEILSLIQYSRLYYSRMWMFATAGNLSVLDPESGVIWITASGRDKSMLAPEDFIGVNLKTGESIDEDSPLRPSAETSIHTSIYSLFPSAGCILHVHAPTSCILEFQLSKENPSKFVTLPNTEILKAYGNFLEEPNLKTLVVHNHGHVPRISDEFKKNFQNKKSDVPFFLIENHGITVWGKNVYDANKNLEATEFVLQVMKGRRLGN